MTSHPSHDDPLAAAGRAVSDRAGHAPPAVTDAAVAAFRAQHASRPGWTPARVVLALAAAAGLAMDVPVLFGAPAHTTTDVAVLHVAMAVGMAIAAWRPARYAFGMTPVVAVAAVLLFLPASAGIAGAAVDPIAELSHLPVLVGAAALLMGRGLRPSGSPLRAGSARRPVTG